MKKITGSILVLLVFWGSVRHVHSMDHPAQTLGSVPPTIISFTHDLDAITLEAAEAGSTDVTFSWRTVGDNLQVQLHIYQINEWLNVLAEDDDPLPTTGQHKTQVRHSQTFSPPMYRLVIVPTNGDPDILDERVIVIPYDVSDLPRASSIDSFTAAANSVDANALALGQVQIPVSWQVSNRLPGVNLVFEQVFDDRSIANIELPRPNLWVSSSGSGIVIPQMPPSGSTVRLRLRLVDLETDVTLQEMSLTLSITGQVVPTQTPRPVSPTLPPTAPPAPSGATMPQLILFTASPSPYTPGQPLTLTWDVRGATSVRIVQTHWDGAETTIAANQTPAGSWTFSLPVPADYRYPYVLKYQVFPTNSAGQEVVDGSMVIRVPVACPFEFFFGPVTGQCPEFPTPQQAAAAYQTFERGFMVWRAGGSILVFFADGNWELHTDPWTDGTPIPTIDQTPPAGLQIPERGFGYLWATNQGIRDRLGWATADELSYQAAWQDVSRRTPNDNREPRNSYLSLPNSRIVYMQSQESFNWWGIWQYVN